RRGRGFGAADPARRRHRPRAARASGLLERAQQLFRSDDWTANLVRESEKILVAGHKIIRPSGDGELQERDIERVPARRRPGQLRRYAYRLAIGEVVSQ